MFFHKSADIAVMQITGYEITNELLREGQRGLYEGIHITDNRKVLIKTFSEPIPSPIDMVYLKHEAQLLSEASIAGTLVLQEVIRRGRHLALIFPHFSGVRLTSIKDLNFEEKLKIAISITQTVAEIHNKNIIHKAISGHNILVDRKTLQIRVMNFAIATKLPREFQEIKSFSALEGDLAYMSPEQTGRMNRLIDYRSDFYSLGVTLYEMFAGELPFSAKDSAALVELTLSKSPASLSIHPMLSKILQKCLAKKAEHRYQSASGIKRDIERCLELGSDGEFDLAASDASSKFQLSQRLYGREAQISTLLKAFEAAPSAPISMLMVSGQSGIGKSSVINEIQKPIVARRGHYSFGKFDQFKKNVPYAAFSEALTNLIDYFLAEDKPIQEKYRLAIKENLKENVRVVAELVPNLVNLIGPIEVAKDPEPNENQSRFLNAFKAFLNTLASAEHPLVLCIDDLQWADLATLDLLEHLLCDRDTKNVLLVGSYRSNEVDRSHPLHIFMQRCLAEKVQISQIDLTNIDENDVNMLIADSLRILSVDTKPLATYIFERTGGNPFFTTQLFQHLYDEGYIQFNLESAKWQWDIGRITLADMPTDIIDLLQSQMQKLSGTCRSYIEIASCMGVRFDLISLAMVVKKEPAATLDILFEAMEKGLIMAPSFDCRLFIAGRSQGQEKRWLRFMHDRIHQAALMPVTESDKKIYRLDTGRLLVRNLNEEEIRKQIFEIVEHYNAGIDLISDQDELLRLCKLNQVAGHQARNASAFKHACAYFQHALKAISHLIWQKEFNHLSSEISHDLATSYYMNKQYQKCEDLAHEILARSENHVFKGRSYIILLQLRMTQGRQKEAVQFGVAGLEVLGSKVPSKFGIHFALVLELIKCLYFYRTKSAAELENLPLVANEEMKYIQYLMGALIPASHGLNDILTGYFGIKIFNLSVRHGITSFSLVGFTTAGLVLNTILKQRHANYILGSLGIKICDRYRFSAVKAQVYGMFAITINPFFHSFAKTKRYLREAFLSGQESGDLLWANYAGTALVLGCDLDGSTLTQRAEELEIARDFAEKTAADEILNGLTFQEQTLCRLRGQPFLRNNVSRAAFELQPRLNMIRLVTLLKMSYIMEEQEEALESSDTTLNPMTIDPLMNPSTYLIEFFAFYPLSLYTSKNARQRAGQKRWLLSFCNKYLKQWANNGAPYLVARYHLVLGAELESREKYAGAAEHYREAIRQAIPEHLFDMLGIANERLGQVLIKDSQDQEGEHLIGKAEDYYRQWHAVGKTLQMQQKYPFLKKRELKVASD